MMIKKLVVNNNEFEFFFDEELNMWRLIDTMSIIYNEKIDLEINLGNIEGNIDWNEINEFIVFFLDKQSLVNHRIREAKNVLVSLFKEIFKGAYTPDFFKFFNIRRCRS